MRKLARASYSSVYPSQQVAWIDTGINTPARSARVFFFDLFSNVVYFAGIFVL